MSVKEPGKQWEDILAGRRPMSPGQLNHLPRGTDELSAWIDHIGRAGELWLREKTLMRWCLDEMSNRILHGTLGSEHRGLLIAFLRNLDVQTDYKTCLAVVGKAHLYRQGARGKDVEARFYEARELYEYLIDTGESDEEALKQAWIAWTFDPDEEEADPEVAKATPAGKNSNVYEQQLQLLKVMLNKAGSRKPAKKGRKPKENKN